MKKMLAWVLLSLASLGNALSDFLFDLSCWMILLGRSLQEKKNNPVFLFTILLLCVLSTFLLPNPRW